MSEKDDFEAELKKVTDLLNQHGYKEESNTLTSALSIATTTSGLGSEAKLDMYSAGAVMLDEAHHNLSLILGSDADTNKTEATKQITDALPAFFTQTIKNLGKNSQTRLQ